MSASSLPIARNLAHIFRRGTRASSGPAADLGAFLDRTRQRLYSENVPVLTSWWLKTIYYTGHSRAWWEELNRAIEKALRNEALDAGAVEGMRDVRAWVRTSILHRHKLPELPALLTPPFRPDLTPAQAPPYLTRVLNEWLPGEVSRLLTSEPQFADTDDGGMPPLAVATALERLLLRERFSKASLELLLRTAWNSPEYVYPAHVEILGDVLLALLGRTAAPPSPVLPATLLAGGFASGLDSAFLVPSVDGDELHVPLEATDAMELLQHDPVRIESIVVTMDGRWWESVRLQRGVESLVAYRPGGRLRIDFSSQHARLKVPGLDVDGRWPGTVHLRDHVTLFGREWHGRAWDRSADRTWLHLEFSDALRIPETQAPERTRLHHLRPASIEIAWSEVEQALAAGKPESIDQIHRGDLIPLTHALNRLADSLLRWSAPRADIDQAVVSVRYLHSAVAPVYGRIPWRVLPSPSGAALLKRRADPAFAGLLTETFEGAPPAVQTSPPRAA